MTMEKAQKIMQELYNPFFRQAACDGHDRNDHNDIWQDGALMMDFGDGKCVAYFAAFTQQVVPTDELGNPLPGGHTISLSPDPRR